MKDYKNYLSNERFLIDKRNISKSYKNRYKYNSESYNDRLDYFSIFKKFGLLLLPLIPLTMYLATITANISTQDLKDYFNIFKNKIEVSQALKNNKDNKTNKDNKIKTKNYLIKIQNNNLNNLENKIQKELTNKKQSNDNLIDQLKSDLNKELDIDFYKDLKHKLENSYLDDLSDILKVFPVKLKDKDIKVFADHAVDVYKKNKETIDSIVESTKIPFDVVLGVIGVEHGIKDSKTGAKGIMQLFQAAAKDALEYNAIKGFDNKLKSEYLNLKYKIKNVDKRKQKESLNKYIKSKINSKEDNIKLGIIYLKKLYDYYFPDWSLALFAYNQGVSLVSKLIYYYKSIKTGNWYPAFYNVNKNKLINRKEMYNYIKEEDLNLSRILEFGKIKKLIKDSENATPTYIPRIIEIKDEIKNKIENRLGKYNKWTINL